MWDALCTRCARIQALAHWVKNITPLSLHTSCDKVCQQWNSAYIRPVIADLCSDVAQHFASIAYRDQDKAFSNVV